MKRQGLITTIRELTILKRELIEDLQHQNILLGRQDIPIDYEQKVQINIINKTPECSDTWEIEDSSPKTAIKREEKKDG